MGPTQTQANNLQWSAGSMEGGPPKCPDADWGGRPGACALGWDELGFTEETTEELKCNNPVRHCFSPVAVIKPPDRSSRREGGLVLLLIQGRIRHVGNPGTWRLNHLVSLAPPSEDK